MISSKSEVPYIGRDSRQHAYHICGIQIPEAFFRLKHLKFNITYEDKGFQCYTYETYVGPILGYGSVIWSP